MSQGLLQLQLRPLRRAEPISTCDATLAQARTTERDELEILANESHRPEGRDRIRQAVALGKVRVLPDPKNPERVRIVAIGAAG